MGSSDVNLGKVGILTYIHNVNYGSALQAFALQKAVESLGYYAEVVDFQDTSSTGNARERRRRLVSGFFSALRAPRVTLRLREASGHARVQSKEKQAAFLRFEQENIRYSQGDFTEGDAYDALICGSDQVWSLSVPGLNRTFFLRFAPAEKRIAYAPSFGCDSVPPYNKRRLALWLSGFAHISVREKSGVHIVEALTGLKPECVLDPVLLMGRDFWNHTVKRIEADVDGCSQTYALGYFLSDNDPAVEQVGRLSQESGVGLLWVDTGVSAPKGATLVCPGPLEFVALLRDAAWVATDSFHGLAFSLIFSKDFYLFNRAYEGNVQQSTRIDSILEIVGSSQGAREEVLRLDSSTISWEMVDAKLQEERELSARYLSNALNDVCSKHRCGRLEADDACVRTS